MGCQDLLTDPYCFPKAKIDLQNQFIGPAYKFKRWSRLLAE